jgi:hypothetical protein
MRLRRQPPAPCACGCQQLADRLAEAEAFNAAIAAAVVVLRPRHNWQTAEQGLIAWGVRPDDARLLAEAIRQSPAKRE